MGEVVAMAMITLKGPWKGMDLRETDAEEGTYFLGLNVDTSQGTIMARPVMEYLTSFSRLQFPTATVFDCPPFDPVVIDFTAGYRVTISSPDNLAEIEFVDLSLEPVPLTALRQSSWVQAYLSSGGQAVPVAILVTPFNSYVYDPRLPVNSTSQMRRLDPATNALRVNSVNYSYWASIPRGPIAVTHQTRVYYAGFDGTSQASLVSPVEADQSSKMEAVLASGRAAINLNPSMIYWSDESDPAGIRADHFLQVGFGETVTGMASTGEVLVIFTDRSIYVLTGYSDDTFQLVKAVDGTGCVSHQSIVTEAGVTYFASADGIYAFGGLGAPEAMKLTEGLQQLWSGWGLSSDQLPDPARTMLQANTGWPWTFDPTFFRHIQGRVLPTRNVIMWTMPVAGESALNQWRCTLVYDLKRRGWNIWTQNDAFTNIFEALEVRGTELLIAAAGLGYRLRRTALENGSYTASVPMYWVSQRIMGDEDNYRQCLGVRMKLLSTGVFPTAGGIPTVGSDAVSADLPMVVVEGEEASYDTINDAGATNGYDSRRTRTQALELHPNSGGTYFYGAGVFGTATFTPLDWFTSTMQLNMTSRWFRIAIIDDPYTSSARSNAVNVASLTLELGSPESPNR